MKPSLQQGGRRSESAPSEPHVLEAAFESAVDGIIAVDSKGRILGWNRRFVEMWGIPPGIIETRSEESLSEWVIDRLVDPDGYTGRIQYLQTHPTQVSRDEVQLKDGHAFDRYSAPLRNGDGGHGGRLWFFRDITERKRAEEELRSANERLKELNAMKTHFVNTAAHELGTPMTPIQLQVTLLLSGRLGNLAPPQKEALEVVDRNVKRLDELVRDILDAAKVQANRLDMKRNAVNLNKLVEEAVASFRAPAEHAEIQLTTNLASSLRVNADPRRIGQVLYNLLGNAIKFTPPGGKIRVVTVKEGSLAVVHVEDTGQGLAPDDFRKLFQPFSQVHDTFQRTQAGRGLGLVISQGIVEEHGGRMWCDSPGIGKGSTFSFGLPLQEHKAEAAAAEAEAPTKAPATAKRGAWTLIYFKCPVCESRDINMRFIKNVYECAACKHVWR